MPDFDENGNPPVREDGTLAFELLSPLARREYLDGWGHVVIAQPAAARAGLFFRIGAAEARQHIGARPS